MAELEQVRLHLIDSETGEDKGEVDVKTSDEAVILKDGTTLANWRNGVENTQAQTIQLVASHLAKKVAITDLNQELAEKVKSVGTTASDETAGVVKGGTTVGVDEDGTMVSKSILVGTDVESAEPAQIILVPEATPEVTISIASDTPAIQTVSVGDEGVGATVTTDEGATITWYKKAVGSDIGFVATDVTDATYTVDTSAEGTVLLYAVATAEGADPVKSATFTIVILPVEEETTEEVGSEEPSTEETENSESNQEPVDNTAEQTE